LRNLRIAPIFLCLTKLFFFQFSSILPIIINFFLIFIEHIELTNKNNKK
jgi:hypothetical protein